MSTVPYVSSANLLRLLDQAEKLVGLVDRCEDTRTMIAEAAADGRIDDGLTNWARDDLEQAEQAIATMIAEIVCDYTNVLNGTFQERLATGFLGQHPTLHANLLRAVLIAAQQRKGDGRIPEWAQNSESLAVQRI